MRKHPSFARRLGVPTLAAVFVSQTVVITVVPAAPPEVPPGSIWESGAPIMLPGAGGVTDGGAATYTLPLRMPDGPNRLQPSLAISYGGSVSANGALGVGMGLAGISAITPCPKT